MVEVNRENKLTLFEADEPLHRKLYTIGTISPLWLFAFIRFETPTLQRLWKVAAILTMFIWIISIGWIFLLIGYVSKTRE